MRLRGAEIVGPLDLEAALLLCPLRLEDCRFSAPVSLAEAQAPAVWIFACQLAELHGEQLHTRRTFSLARTRATGEVDLRGAHIGGQLGFTGATLSGDSGRALSADRLQVDGNMFCDEGFAATGEVRLLGAHIAGQLSFKGATLSNDSGPALSGDRLQVDQDMFCDEGFTAAGEVRLLGAHIAGQLDFTGGRLTAAPIDVQGQRISLGLEDANVRTLVIRFASTPAGLIDMTAAGFERIVDRTYDADRVWPRCRLSACPSSFAGASTSTVASSSRPGFATPPRRIWSPRAWSIGAPSTPDEARSLMARRRAAALRHATRSAAHSASAPRRTSALRPRSTPGSFDSQYRRAAEILAECRSLRNARARRVSVITGC